MAGSTVQLQHAGKPVDSTNPLPVTATLPALGATDDASASSDTGTFSLISLFKRLLAKLTTTIGVAGTPSASATTVQGLAYTGTATVTRAANTTTYAANDVVGGALTIANVGPSGGSVFVTGVQLLQNISAVPSGQTSFRLYLYNATPPSAIADNSPFTLGSGDRAAFLGYIDIGTPALLGTGTGTPQSQLDNINKQVKLLGSTSLFAYLVTDGALVPAGASETYSLLVPAVAA